MANVNLETGEASPVDPRDWARSVLAIELDAKVPEDIAAMFVMAKQATCFYYWYWPMLVLGSHELLRVAESAVRAIAKQHGIKAKTLKDRIAALVKVNVIAESDEELWQAQRSLRNSATHPDFQQMYGFSQAMTVIKTVAEAVGSLKWRGTDVSED
jgi:hypothetical protein